MAAYHRSEAVLPVSKMRHHSRLVSVTSVHEQTHHKSAGEAPRRGLGRYGTSHMMPTKSQPRLAAHMAAYLRSEPVLPVSKMRHLGSFRRHPSTSKRTTSRQVRRPSAVWIGMARPIRCLPRANLDELRTWPLTFVVKPSCPLAKCDIILGSFR